jgi:hypothetical protein
MICNDYEQPERDHTIGSLCCAGVGIAVNSGHFSTYNVANVADNGCGPGDNV